MRASQQLHVVRDGARVRVRLGGPIKPAYQEVADRLRRGIERGDLRSGDKLPSENEMAAVFETARETVRRGLLLLAEGEAPLIVGRQGSGWFVS